jgi:hypothetical protein
VQPVAAESQVFAAEAESQREPEREGSADEAAAPVAEGSAEPEAEAVPTEQEPEAKIEQEPEAKAETAATEAQAEPQAEAETKTQQEPEAQPEGEAEAVSALKQEPQPAAEATAVEREAALEAEPEPHAEAAEPAPEQEPEAKAELEAEAEPQPEAKAQSDAMATAVETEAVLGAEPEAEAEPEGEVEPEAEVEPAPSASVSTTEAEPAGSGAAAEAEPQTQPEPSTVAAVRKRPSRRVLIAGGIAALAAAVGIGTAIAVTSGSSQPGPRTSNAPAAAPTTPAQAPSARPARPPAAVQPAAIAGVRAWLKTNIAPSQRISADPDLVSELQSAGFAAAHVEPGYPGAPDWRADNVIISTPQTRAQAASVPALTAELASSIPVAVFGAGTQSVEARMVFGTNNPDILSVQAQRQDDATNRRLAGEALLRNPRVTIAPAWSTLVSTGGLDLRPAVVIGLIAARTDVSVVAVKVDPAENAAGTPARTVRLSIPPSVLPGILATLPVGYRPDRISSPTQSNTQLTELSWGVTLTPQPTLS